MDQASSESLGASAGLEIFLPHRRESFGNVSCTSCARAVNKIYHSHGPVVCFQARAEPGVFIEIERRLLLEPVYPEPCH
jgi:hypothetical protein